MLRNLRVAAAAAAVVLVMSSPCPAGNLEVLVREGDELVHYRAVPGKEWNRVATITKKAAGPGALSQNANGNLEVVVPEEDGLVHYLNDGTKWVRGSGVVSKKATGPGAILQRMP